MSDGDATITVTVNVTGGGGGQVDFQTVKTEGDRTYPQVVHVADLDDDGKAVITAPATYAEPLYVSAVRELDGFPSKDDIGAAAEPITLAGQDLTLDLAIGTTADWMNPFVAEHGSPPPPPDGSGGGAPGGGAQGAGGPPTGAGGPPDAGGAGGAPPEGAAGGPPPAGDAGGEPPPQ